MCEGDSRRMFVDQEDKKNKLYESFLCVKEPFRFTDQAADLNA